MQRALLSFRQSQRTRSTIYSRTWPKRRHLYETRRSCLASRRYISFPAFIPHAPSSTTAEALAKPDRNRGAHDDENLSFPEALRIGIAQALSRKPQTARGEATLPEPGSSLYGKWHELSLDEDRLLHEFDVKVSDSTLVREIDQPGNEHDIQLWTCLLESAHRRMGHDGIIMIWQSISKRRNLFQIDGPLAPRLWRLILNAAVSDETLLRDVVDYAEWLYHAHGVRWPEMYSTVIIYMLQSLVKERQLASARKWQDAALRWHFILAPSFGPGENEFVALIKTFIANSSRVVFDTLKSLYIGSPYRELYDSLIPHLYSEGYAHQALEWRRALLSYNDIPKSLESRQFLRFVGGYFEQTGLTEEELNVAGLVPNKLDPDLPHSQSPDAAIPGQNLSYLINRAHGETFGITEKPYNDNLGAKWFASYWVSIDFAINVVYTMGVQAIGPLSLQSIALREEDAAGVLRRIEQLRQLKIKLPDSNYAKAIQHYASLGDNEALQELLQSDMHPDIFENEEAQNALLSDCARIGNWNTYQLILRTRLAVMSNATNSTTDRMLESCARQSKGSMALKIMRELTSRRIEIAPRTSHVLSSFIIDNISPHADNSAELTPDQIRQLVNLHVALGRELSATRFPPAVQVWQALLYRLGREKRLADLERLCFHVLHLYADYARSTQPMWNAHTADVPPILRSESPFPNFQRLPRDLRLRHEKHPLRLIFDPNLQTSIVRWGFMYTSYDRNAEGTAADLLKIPETAAKALPGRFHLARGIRLLAMLRDEGLFVNTSKVRKQAELRLVDLFRGEGRAQYEWIGGNHKKTSLRRQLRFSLTEAKRLCDEAWGKDELVPSLFELERRCHLAESRDTVNEMRRRIDILKDPELARKRRYIK